MEVSSVKRAAGSTLPGFYADNYMAIAKFMLWPIAKEGVTSADSAPIASNSTVNAHLTTAQIYITGKHGKTRCLTASSAASGHQAVSLTNCVNSGEEFTRQQWLIEGNEWVGQTAVVQSAADHTLGQPCLTQSHDGIAEQHECEEGSAVQQFHLDEHGHITSAGHRCLGAGPDGSVVASGCKTRAPEQQWAVRSADARQ